IGWIEPLHELESIMTKLTHFIVTTLVSCVWACGEADDEPDSPVSESMFEAVLPDLETPIRIQVIGDSHLAWNDKNSTGDQVSTVLDERGIVHTLVNRAVGGSTLGCGELGIGSADNCIPPQLENGPWTHLVLSGGGNDFLESGCSAEVDSLMSADLRAGLMTELVERGQRSGARVIIVGYVTPQNPDGEAGSCSRIHELLDRYQRYAFVNDGVAYVAGRQIIRPSQPADYDDDIHTSVRGSRRLAEAIADLIASEMP
ncbi:MAG: SGNH/GDSL hydrolase family protein, partial [Myxococcota bacterium]|nr:SGNH/GDSL hydrolase family protein [Myxococcota bacterium]